MLINRVIKIDISYSKFSKRLQLAEAYIVDAAFVYEDRQVIF